MNKTLIQQNVDFMHCLISRSHKLKIRKIDAWIFSYLLVQDIYMCVGNNSVGKKTCVFVGNDFNVNNAIGNGTRVLQFLKAYYLRAV